MSLQWISTLPRQIHMPTSIDLGNPIIRVFVVGPGYGEAIVVQIGDGLIFGVDCCNALVSRDPVSGCSMLEKIFSKLSSSALAIWGITHAHHDHFQGIEKLSTMLLSSLSCIVLPSVFLDKDISSTVLDELWDGDDYYEGEKKRIRDEFLSFRDQVLNPDSEDIVLGAGKGVEIIRTKGRFLSGIEKEIRISVLAPRFQKSLEVNKKSISRTFEKTTEGNILKGGTSGANESCAIFLVECGDLGLLLTGDAPASECVRALESTGRFPREWAFLKVAHHGSRDGTNSDILGKLWTGKRRQIAAISPFDRYRLPKTSIKKMLRDHKAEIKISGNINKREVEKFQANLEKAGCKKVQQLSKGARTSWEICFDLELMQTTSSQFHF